MLIRFDLSDQADSSLRYQQIARLSKMIQRLSERAGLNRVPAISTSWKERFASVNLFQFRICIGETLLSLWKQGEFNESDVEAVIAHEIGHLMDFKRGSHSASFRNLLLESTWFSCGLVPLVISILFPSATVFRLCIAFAIGWVFSIPLLIRRFERKVEFEADKNAVLFMVEPEQLANALTKMKAMTNPIRFFSPFSGLTGFMGRLTHPTFDDRIGNCVHLSSRQGVTLKHLSHNQAKVLQEIRLEEAQLLEEKRNLANSREQLQKKIVDKIENNMDNLLKLKVEVNQLKVECRELNKILELMPPFAESNRIPLSVSKP
jgi:hypothetical protein